MAVKTIVEIPEAVHAALCLKARQSGSSLDTLIIQAVELAYGDDLQRPAKGKMVTGPMITDGGERGPAYPTDENPHDLVFS